MAHRVDVSVESTPPEMLTIKPESPVEMRYSSNQALICSATFAVFKSLFFRIESRL